MTDKQTLMELAERVEAGEEFGVINGQRGYMYIAVGIALKFTSARLLGIVEDALRGSLDASKRLHDAGLPGWVRDVDATAPHLGVDVTLWKVQTDVPEGMPCVDDSDKVKGCCNDEAAAWVAAILRAKAQETEK